MDGAMAIARLKELAASGPHGRYLLSLLPREDVARDGLTVQGPPAIATAPSVAEKSRPPRYAPVAYMPKHEALRRMLAHFDGHPDAQTISQVAHATQIKYSTAHFQLLHSGRFERDPLKKFHYRPRTVSPAPISSSPERIPHARA